MATLGLSTVMETVVVWYSAGQALFAGTAILATLIAIESWLSQGKVRSLAIAVAASIAAPGIWMGGLVAGPAAAAYLWFADRRGSRRAAVAFLMVSVCLAGLHAGPGPGRHRSKSPSLKIAASARRPRRWRLFVRRAWRSRKPWC